MRDTTGLGAVGGHLDRGAGARCRSPVATPPEGDIFGRSIPPADRLARPVRTCRSADLPRARSKAFRKASATMGEPVHVDADHPSPGSDAPTRYRHAAGAVHCAGACRRTRLRIGLGARRLRSDVRGVTGVRHARGAPPPCSADRRGALPAAPRSRRRFDGHDDSPSGEPIGTAPSGEPIGTAPSGEPIGTARSGQRVSTAPQVYSAVAQLGGVAQLVERFGRIEEARGSIPLTSTASATVA